jgi:hypothetical protein
MYIHVVKDVKHASLLKDQTLLTPSQKVIEKTCGHISTCMSQFKHACFRYLRSVRRTSRSIANGGMTTRTRTVVMTSPTCCPPNKSVT